MSGGSAIADWPFPTLDDVERARVNIAPYLERTPTHRYAGLDELVGASTFVKHENHHAVGAFKVRGGLNLVAQMTDEECARGIICASTGNHGQSLAFAGRAFDVRVTICVPEKANPVKLAAMRGLGAELVENGADYDAAREHAEALAAEHGYRYVHSGNEPHLIAGVGTLYVEMFEDVPDLDYLFVPVGGGSSAAAACIVAQAVCPGLKVVAVQSEQAPSAWRSWVARRLIEDSTSTYAEGLATRTPFEYPQRILWQLLTDFDLVTDDEIRSAQRLMIEHTRNLTESAGAAPLAAALCRDDLAGKRVGLVASGGNVAVGQLRELLVG